MHDLPLKRTSSELSVTRVYHLLRQNDKEALEILWKHYYPKLVTLASRTLNADKLTVYGADEAAASAMRLLWRSHEGSAMDRVQSRDDLWRLLVAATRRKLIDQHRAQTTIKRGGQEQPSELPEQVASSEPTAEELLILNERVESMLGQLRNDTLRKIAIMKLDGYLNIEIAEALDVSERTVERKLQLIRADWEECQCDESKD